MKKILILSVIVILYISLLFSNPISPVLASNCTVSLGNFYLYRTNLNNIRTLLDTSTSFPVTLVNSKELKDGKITGYIFATQTGCDDEFSRWAGTYRWDESRPAGLGPDSECRSPSTSYDCIDRRWAGAPGGPFPDSGNPVFTNWPLGGSGEYMVRGAAYGHARDDSWSWSWTGGRLFFYEEVKNLAIDPATHHLTGALTVPWYTGVNQSSPVNPDPHFYLLIDNDQTTLLNQSSHADDIRIYPTRGAYKNWPDNTYDYSFNFQVDGLTPGQTYYWRIRQEGSMYTTYIPGDRLDTVIPTPTFNNISADGDDQSPYTVYTSTPTISFYTSISTSCRYSSLDQAYDQIPSSQTCQQSGGIMHTCQPQLSDSYGDKNLYFSCVNNDVTNNLDLTINYSPLPVTISASPTNIESNSNITLTYTINSQVDFCQLTYSSSGTYTTSGQSTFSSPDINITSGSWSGNISGSDVIVGSHQKVLTLKNTANNSSSITFKIHCPDFPATSDEQVNIIVGPINEGLRSGNESRVFITRSWYNPNLGGVKGADNRCQQIANTKGFDGVWVAWLSNSEISAKDRLNPTNVQNTYKLLDGNIVASSWSDLTNDTKDLTRIINLTEDRTISDSNPWTNTKRDGSIDTTDKTCNNWTNAFDNSLQGAAGQNGFSDSRWTKFTNYNCGSKYNPLYCFEKLSSAIPEPQPVDVCSGNISLSFDPQTGAAGTQITPKASGLSSCAGKVVNFKNGTNCSGTTFTTCSAGTTGGCSGSNSFAAPASATGYSACVDLNSDTDFTDTGESNQATFTPTQAITAPTNCGSGSTRADGLVSTPTVSADNKFDTSGGCVIDPKAAFAPYKIPTFDDLKSLYYTQR